jgi:hypothetical protein
LAEIPGAALAEILGGNAARLYKLDPTTLGPAGRRRTATSAGESLAGELP